MKKTLLFLAFVACTGIMKAKAQAPVFNAVTANSTSIEKWRKFELTIDLTAAYTNPYDYSDINVQCIFTSPGNVKDTVDGFYMQDYTLDASTGNITSTGTPHFKVRFAPAETGTYNYVLSCISKSGTTKQPAQSFTSTASAAHGFVRKNSTNYLGYDDNTQYIPVGENICWQDANVYTDYTNWLPKLAGNGGNYIRVWMSSWAFAYEWKDVYSQGLYHGLKSYNQYNAFNLDWLLDYCDQQNVNIMLCMNNHGQVSTTVNPEWQDNPYNAANGGPCANTWDFFTNTTAKEIYKNRMRYLVARCGYSKNIMSWELFNEVNFTDQFTSHQTDVSGWHNEMSTYLKALDVNKHLVTTSYADAAYDPNTWNLPNIDFTQTHNYSSVPNLESILVGNNLNYLSAYHKPTLNGEFGLGPDGATLSVDDPAGVHIHNAIWATSLSGAMGSGMTWWWDSYINPQNLYPYYKPLAAFLSSLSLKEENYKPATGSTSGGGASDLSISPGAGFVKAPASNFTVDANGKLTPDASQLSQYIFGSTYNTQYRNPPTFTVTYPVAGQFKVNVGGVSGSSPMVTIKVDNVQVTNVAAVTNTTYSVDVAAGAHTITVDNLGIDWFNVTGYVFTNIGSPLSTYLIKSADSNKVAGWELNSQYNWQYLKSNGNVAPPVISGASLNVSGMKNGQYTIQFFNCSTGANTGTATTAVTNGALSVALPDIAWDAAFTITNNAVLPVTLNSFTGETKNGSNYLNISIAAATNVKTVVLERSSNGIAFATLANVGNGWNKPEGNHVYIDAAPLPGNNYYRLRIQDADGRIETSGIILLNSSGSRHFSVYPNPAKAYVRLFTDAGTYTAKISDAQGRVLLTRSFTVAANAQATTIPVAGLATGVYYLSVTDTQGRKIASQKIVKQ